MHFSRNVHKKTGNSLCLDFEKVVYPSLSDARFWRSEFNYKDESFFDVLLKSGS